MLLSSLKTTFVEKSAPYLSAQKLNDLWTSIDAIIDALKTLPVDQASWNATGATSTSYKLTSYRESAPDASELPLAFVIVPTITNGADATITASWGATAYQIWDMTTNARVTAGVIVANRPVQLVFDGTKFWVVGAAAIVHGAQHEPSGSDAARFVFYGGPQTLESAEQSQARVNIKAAGLDANSKVVASESSSHIFEYSDSHTLILTNAGGFVKMTKSTANNLTVPPNSSVAFPVGTEIEYMQYGAGQVTLVAGAGVTIRNPYSATKTSKQYASGGIKKIGTDEWVSGGDLVP